jgi:hypothetical protein
VTNAPDISLNAIITKPYRWRSFLRGALPNWAYDMWAPNKGVDCEMKGGAHEWYNHDNVTSACYHCSVIRTGQLWKQGE